MRILLLILCLQPALLSAAPRVVTSIPPLQEIAAGLMQGIGEPQVIIADEASAHHFSFRPSQMARLQRAELVIWVDRGFESGFARVPEILPDTTLALEILAALDLAGSNGHFWYAPRLLAKSIDLVAAPLARLDPEHAARYRANALQLKSAVESWRQHIVERWRNGAPVLLTAHDFLRPFADEFGFFDIESIYDRHDTQGGLKDLRRLEARLREAPPACLLTLESELPALAESLAAKYRLRIVYVEKSTPDDGGKPALIRRLDRLEAAIERCASSG